MWLLPVSLVLFSAVLHASWNLLVKRQDDKLFSGWLTFLVPGVLLAPALAFTGTPPREVWPLLGLSGVIHALYMIALIRAYGHGDLSVVYPVARGTAPLLVAVGAPVLLSERLSTVGLLGICLVGGGIACVGLSTRRSPSATRGLAWALVTAATIAAYSITDKVGVARARPLAYVIVLLLFTGVLLTPYVLWRRDVRQLGALWRQAWPSAALGGLLSLLAYLLVLTAMQLTQVSYVAALRETSVVVAAVFGARLLDEPYGGRRTLASVVVAGGLVLLILAMRG